MNPADIMDSSLIWHAARQRETLLEDAIDNANDAAYNWIYAELMEDEMDLPPVSDESDLTLQEGDVVRNIQVTIRMYDGWDE